LEDLIKTLKTSTCIAVGLTPCRSPERAKVGPNGFRQIALITMDELEVLGFRTKGPAIYTAWGIAPNLLWGSALRWLMKKTWVEIDSTTGFKWRISEEFNLWKSDMSRVVFFIATSLGGYIANPDGTPEWLLPDAD